MNPSRPNTVRLQRIARAYRETGALLAAVELDLFSKISEGANTEGLLVNSLGISELNAERIVVACLGLGLIIRNQEFIENAPDVERFLVKSKSTYAGEWIFFTHPDWDRHWDSSKNKAYMSFSRRYEATKFWFANVNLIYDTDYGKD